MIWDEPEPQPLSPQQRALESEHVRRHHRREAGEGQCTSAVVRHIRAPVHLVWSLVRRFDEPQKYKPFVRRCVVVQEGGGGQQDGDDTPAQPDKQQQQQRRIRRGCVREVNVRSGLPATTSTERLEFLDDNQHILSVKIVGGDHRLKNYSSVITLHPETTPDGHPGTLVIESFVVDIPEGNTAEDTRFFVEALLKFNLKSLADVSERLVKKEEQQQQQQEQQQKLSSPV